jgi:hypothetical protein
MTTKKTGQRDSPIGATPSYDGIRGEKIYQ